MNDQLEKQLVEKYPHAFSQKDEPYNNMRFGCECDDGWYNIIEPMLEAMTYTYKISFLVTNSINIKKYNIEPMAYKGGSSYYYTPEPPTVVLDQVKEKFGTLRVYFHLEFDKPFLEMAYGDNPEPEATKCANRYSNYMDGIVHMSEVLSSRTCEFTGLPGKLHSAGGWFKTLNTEYAKTELANRNYKIAE